MSDKKSKLHIISGPVSSGKTSVIQELKKRGFKTISESARDIINKNFDNGLTMEEMLKDREKFQIDILKLDEQKLIDVDEDELTFFDRGPFDAMGYMIENGIDESFGWKVINGHKFGQIFWFEPINKQEDDNTRKFSTPEVERNGDIIFDTYKDAGYTPISVPSFSVTERVDFILSKI